MAKISWSRGWYIRTHARQIVWDVTLTFSSSEFVSAMERESRSLVRHGRVAGFIRGLGVVVSLSHFHLDEDSSIQHHGKEGVTRRP